MNKHLFNSLVSDPNLLDEKSLSQLKETIEEYPFFQLGRMLMLKNLHKLDHIKFNSELKHSAAYIADRKKLYNLLHNYVNPLEQITEEVETNTKTDTISDEAVIEEPIINKATTEDHSQIEVIADKQSNETDKVSLTDNYLNASDELEGLPKLSNAFDNPNSEIDSTEDNLENIVLPAADLLDYERSATPSYSLDELEKSNEEETNTNHSFSDWLLMMKAKKEKAKKIKKTGAKMDLIENFLNTDPKISTQVTSTKKDIDLSTNQNTYSEDIMSETLANIFIKQGHNSKAISILEKLRLKYPEKNVYFARRISELKEN